MPRFFVEQVGNCPALTGEDAAHAVKSLRMRVGEELTLCDSSRMDHRCVVRAVTPDTVELAVLESTPNEAELPCRVSLYVALPKADKLELIVQKAVELGVYEVIPVLSARCVSRPDAKSMRTRIVRLNRIALEAAKQCGRGMVPAVGELLDFDTALTRMRTSSLAMLCYEKGGEELGSLLPPYSRQSIALMTGSEGGFEPEEAERARLAGVVPVTLGKRILRAETAPLYALSVIAYLNSALGYTVPCI